VASVPGERFAFLTRTFYIRLRDRPVPKKRQGREKNFRSMDYERYQNRRNSGLGELWFGWFFGHRLRIFPVKKLSGRCEFSPGAGGSVRYFSSIFGFAQFRESGRLALRWADVRVGSVFARSAKLASLEATSFPMNFNLNRFRIASFPASLSSFFVNLFFFSQ
jgi:hypothetical protein